MSIRLGLSRVESLLNLANGPQIGLKVLHVAGTNGKGSVCAYLSELLKGPSTRVGRFTSPHLLTVRDSITIDNVIVDKSRFHTARNELLKLKSVHKLNCSNFELLTCTAIKCFQDHNCDWCVIETGLGGRLDATNALAGVNKVACAITKIALDHQAFLGDKYSDIAAEKAGIVTPGVQFTVCDGSNNTEVLDTVAKACHEMEVPLYITPNLPMDDSVALKNDNNSMDCTRNLPGNELFKSVYTESWGTLKFSRIPLNGIYQMHNLRVAIKTIDQLQCRKLINLTAQDILQRVQRVQWPGRLQVLKLRYDISKPEISVIIDGAHNGGAATELAKYLHQLHGRKEPICFITGVTNGKGLKALFDPLITSKDIVITTGFSHVEEMPWVQSVNSTELAQYLQRYTPNVHSAASLAEVWKLITPFIASNMQVVIFGSLYLCADILRLQEKNNAILESMQNQHLQLG